MAAAHPARAQADEQVEGLDEVYGGLSHGEAIGGVGAGDQGADLRVKRPIQPRGVELGVAGLVLKGVLEQKLLAELLRPRRVAGLLAELLKQPELGPVLVELQVL